ncbi:MAG: tRNA pseudouridine(38-40) synthase TruA [Desulfovibrio sp.]|nr:tRNA pseudouridine(38-40) synthase TruA [Desulfovibrio sp.]
MRRLKLLVAYVGTRYAGWQLQDARKSLPTIQGELERALGRLAGRPVRVHGSGRTDAGVHAHGQVAHCDVPADLPPRPWRHALNALLPMDVRVLDVMDAPAGFDARRSAGSKTYRYRFWQETAFVPPHLVPFVWRCGPLDRDAVEAVLPMLTGTRDFASLRNVGTKVRDCTRTVFGATIGEGPACEHYPPHLPELRFDVTADGFLKQMVRNMAGLLHACGKGRLDPGAVPELLRAGDRTALPVATAPACGLCLLRVDYSGER